MKITRFFLPLLKENPSEAVMSSHRLMLRTGMIRQAVSGIFCWLPLGKLVLDRIDKIIREEQQRVGALEIVVPCLQPTSLWEESHRNQAYGKEMLRLQDRHGKEMIYAPTNEEQITDIFRQTVTSYKQLPLLIYLIGNKFRDEIRPRFGTMRSREFIMKDGYSFDLTAELSRATYQKIFVSYLKIFKRLGVTAYPVQACTGAIGGDLSHEFVIPTATGDTTVSAHPDFYKLTATEGEDEQLFKLWTAHRAVNNEYVAENKTSVNDEMTQVKGIEIAHLFYFGQKYTKVMKASIENQQGVKVFPYMGSYGIGTSRLVATIIEAHHDDKGIVWPAAAAPFQINLLNLDAADQEAKQVSDEIYATLRQQGVTVLYDDTSDSPGVKFNRADLLGLPWQIIVGKRELAQKQVILKRRSDQQREYLSKESALQKMLTQLTGEN